MRQLLINGEWVDAASTAGREIANPATLAPIDTVPECGSADVDRAVAAARDAAPGWRALAHAERADRLHTIGERILAHRDTLAALITREAGAPLCESQDSIGWTAAEFQRGAERPGEPAGALAAAIASSFEPLHRSARRVAQSLAAGRAVICKPPDLHPLAGLMLAELCAPLLPAGVLNVVTGGAEAAATLRAHPDVIRAESAAGPPAAQPPAAQPPAADPAAAIVVLEDAPLDLAVAGVAWARLKHAGQGHGARVRIYVEQAIAAPFADRLHEYMAFLEVGDPGKADTDLGPLISRDAARRVEEQVAHACKEGARLKLGGRCYRPWGLPGHFFQPTILTGVGPGSAAARVAMHGPVVLITPVADAAEALRHASELGAGTRLSLYTACAARVQELGRSFTAGPLAHVTERPPWWFPYRDRKRPSTGWRDLASHDADA